MKTILSYSISPGWSTHRGKERLSKKEKKHLPVYPYMSSYYSLKNLSVESNRIIASYILVLEIFVMYLNSAMLAGHLKGKPANSIKTLDLVPLQAVYNSGHFKLPNYLSELRGTQVLTNS